MRRVLSTPKHAHGLCAQIHVNVWHFQFRSASVFNEKCVITGERARYRDPITLSLMSDPMVLSSGHHFDRSTLYAPDGKFRFERCPMTREVVAQQAYPILFLRAELIEFKLRRLDGVLDAAAKCAPREPRLHLLAYAKEVLDALGGDTYHHRAARYWQVSTRAPHHATAPHFGEYSASSRSTTLFKIIEARANWCGPLRRWSGTTASGRCRCPPSQRGARASAGAPPGCFRFIISIHIIRMEGHCIFLLWPRVTSRWAGGERGQAPPLSLACSPEWCPVAANCGLPRCV